MILPDVNVLVHAHNADSADHEKALGEAALGALHEAASPAVGG